MRDALLREEPDLGLVGAGTAGREEVLAHLLRGVVEPARFLDRRPAAEGSGSRRQLPDASAPVTPVAAGDEVVIVAGLFKGKVASVLGTATDGSVELTVGRLRMTLVPADVRKIP